MKSNYKMLKSRRDDTVVARLKKELDAFKELLPMMAEVRRGAGTRQGHRRMCGHQA